MSENESREHRERNLRRRLLLAGRGWPTARSTASSRPPSATRAATSTTRPTSRSAPAHRPRRGDPGHVRPRRVSYEELVDKFFEHPRPDPGQPPGPRRRRPVPDGDLHPLPTSRPRPPRRRSKERAQERFNAADRDHDRARAPGSGAPRSTTSATSRSAVGRRHAAQPDRALSPVAALAERPERELAVAQRLRRARVVVVGGGEASSCSREASTGSAKTVQSTPDAARRGVAREPS